MPPSPPLSPEGWGKNAPPPPPNYKSCLRARRKANASADVKLGARPRCRQRGGAKMPPSPPLSPEGWGKNAPPPPPTPPYYKSCLRAPRSSSVCPLVSYCFLPCPSFLLCSSLFICPLLSFLSRCLSSLVLFPWFSFYLVALSLLSSCLFPVHFFCSLPLFRFSSRFDRVSLVRHSVGFLLCSSFLCALRCLSFLCFPVCPVVPVFVSLLWPSSLRSLFIPLLFPLSSCLPPVHFFFSLPLFRLSSRRILFSLVRRPFDFLFIPRAVVLSFVPRSVCVLFCPPVLFVVSLLWSYSLCSLSIPLRFPFVFLYIPYHVCLTLPLFRLSYRLHLVSLAHLPFVFLSLSLVPFVFFFVHLSVAFLFVPLFSSLALFFDPLPLVLLFITRYPCFVFFFVPRSFRLFFAPFRLSSRHRLVFLVRLPSDCFFIRRSLCVFLCPSFLVLFFVSRRCPPFPWFSFLSRCVPVVFFVSVHCFFSLPLIRLSSRRHLVSLVHPKALNHKPCILKP